MIFDETVDMAVILTRVAAFFRDESCGQCVPCRVGSAKAHRILTGALSNGGPASVDGQIRELEETMRKTSICGLGQVALGPVVSVLRLNASGSRDEA